MQNLKAVGIDVSKRTLDICVLGEGKEKYLKIKNNKKDILKSCSKLEKLGVNKSTQVVIESTGDYSIIPSQLYEEKFDVQLINPLISKRLISVNIRKVKTDKEDSKILAELGLNNKLNNHKAGINEILKRKLISQLNSIEKHKAALKLSCKRNRKTLETLGINLTSFDEIEKAIKKLEEISEDLERQLGLIIENKDLVKSLSKIKGIGTGSSNILVALLEDREFNTKKAIIAYSGLDVSTKESGQYRGKVRITKRGNPYLRKVLVRIAWGLMMHNEKVQKYIERYKESGRKYRELMVIVARKVLRMLYGAMKSNEEFSLNYLTTV